MALCAVFILELRLENNLLAFSCKRRHFCPSWHQKRVIEFGEWLCAEVLQSVLKQIFKSHMTTHILRFHRMITGFNRKKPVASYSIPASKISIFE